MPFILKTSTCHSLAKLSASFGLKDFGYKCFVFKMLLVQFFCCVSSSLTIIIIHTMTQRDWRVTPSPLKWRREMLILNEFCGQWKNKAKMNPGSEATVECRLKLRCSGWMAAIWLNFTKIGRIATVLLESTIRNSVFDKFQFLRALANFPLILLRIQRWILRFPSTRKLKSNKWSAIHPA